MKNICFTILFVVIASIVSSQPLNSPGHAKMKELPSRQDVSADVTNYQANGVKAVSDLGNTPDVNWVKQFGGDGADAGQDIVTDANGNSYIAGSFSGPVSFGATTLTSTGLSDAFVAKYSNTGALLWVRQISCGMYETAKGTGIALDHLNNVFITGYFNGPVLHAGTTDLARIGAEDIFLASYDAAGNFLMAGSYGVEGLAKQSKSIAVDGEGNAFVVAGGEYTASSGGNYILKFDGYGHLDWEYTNGARFYDLAVKNHIVAAPGPMPACISIDPPNATAFDSITVTFNPAQSCFLWQSLVGSPQVNMHSGVTIGGQPWAIYVPYNGQGANGQSTQLTANGDGTYSMRFRPSAFYGIPEGTEVTQLCFVFNNGVWDSRDGRDYDLSSETCMDIFVPLNYNQGQPDVYLNGFIGTQVNFGSTTLTATASVNAPFLAKCDPAGNFSWAVQGVSSGSGSMYNRAYSVAVDENDHVYFSGRFRKSLTFGGINLNNTSNDYTTFLVRSNAAGTFEWAKSAIIPVPGYYQTYNQPVNVAVDDIGNPFISFSLFNHTLVFGPNGVSGTGYCLARYDAGGNEQWVEKKDGAINGISGSSGSKILYTGTLGGNALTVQSNSAGNEEWRAQTTGNSGNARATNLELDHNGNIYCYGRTDVPDPMFGATAGTFLARMNPGGSAEWSLPFRGVVAVNNSEGYGNWLAIDQEDNLIVTGHFSDTLTVGAQTLINPGTFDGLFIAKIDLSGNVIWLRQVGNGLSSAYVYSVAADFGNNVIISGVFYNTFNIEGTDLTSAGDLDVFVAKFNKYGNFQWAKRAGGETIEYIGFVSSDSLNNIYLTGEFVSRDVTIDTYPLPLTESDGDVILAKFSPGGSVEWAYAYGSSAVNPEYRYSCWPTAIKTRANGDSYIYGWTGKSNQYGPYLLESPYPHGLLLTKINNTGTVQWAKIIKERGQNWHSLQIDLDQAGNCYVGGNLSDSTWFDNNLVTKQGTYDLFVARYDRDGNFDWAKIFGSNPLNLFENYSGLNYLNGIAAYDTNSLFVGGTFNNDLQFDGTNIHSSGLNGFISLLGDEVPPVPSQCDLNNVTIDENTTRCYNATETIKVAGNGTIFSVQNGGDATLIAGHNILLYPGAKVESGGHLLAKITATASYCPAFPFRGFENEADGPAKSQEVVLNDKSTAFRIYPNPTSGSFTLEFSGFEPKMPVQVEIYGMMGNKVAGKTINETGRHLFSLSGFPSGLYLVKVKSEGFSDIQKVVKQ